MRKDELVAALVASPPAPAKVDRRRDAIPAKRSHVQQQLAAMQHQRRQHQDLSSDRHGAAQHDADAPSQAAPPADAPARDRLVVLVRDPYWLHVSWEIAPRSVQRARRALGQHWHAAAPVLRVLRLCEDGATVGVRQVAIHGRVSHWYIDVDEPPNRFRAEIGYATPSGEWYCIARSNEVRTPKPGSIDAVDQNWADVARNADRIYAMSGGYSAQGASRELQELLEERLRRRLGRPTETRFGRGAAARRDEPLPLEIDAELVVYGTTEPHTHLTLQGEPVEVARDGSFAVRVPFPDRRQVIPVVASSADGMRQRTAILGVERNTKTLDERRRDSEG